MKLVDNREKRGIMALPTKKRFFNKFISAVVGNGELARAYFDRFGIAYFEKTPEEIRGQLIDKLSNYGGYEIRRKLIECVEIRPGDCVLDIGPETGMECLLLAEVYSRVKVAEPDTVTPYLLREIAEYYYTDDGRKASTVLDIQRTGIIPARSTWTKTNQGVKVSGLVDFNAVGAPDINEIFGLNFADRIVCHHIGTLMPAKPQLTVLLTALSSYCKVGGVITYCEEASELEGVVREYAEYKNYGIPKFKYYRYKSLDHWLKFTPSKMKTYMAELLECFNISLRIFSEDHLLTIARHQNKDNKASVSSPTGIIKRL